MKRVNKKLILICFSIVVTLGLTTFFVLNFSETNSEQVSDSVAEQDAENFSLKELSAEEKIYKELIGNLYDEINDLEKEKVQNLIKEIVKIENDDNDTSKKADIYKNIIKILDEVTLRGHHQDELDDYKKYYESTKNAVGSPAKMHQYQIKENGEIEFDLLNGDTSEYNYHKEIWKKAKKIIPFDLLKGIKYFVPFEVDKKRGAYAAGFMQPIDFNSTPYEWSIGVASNANEKDLSYILIHEFGHYISLKDTTIKINAGLNNIKAEGGELLQSFIEKCLGHIAEESENVEDSNRYLFYARHKDDFVTKYAVSNLLEDFAESFAKFVKSSNFESERLKCKMEFFNSRSDLVAIKNQIITNLKDNGIEEIVDMTQ